MSPFNKAVLINVTIAVGLTYEYFRGSTIPALAISAVLLFSTANIALWLKSRRIRNRATKIQ